MNTTYKLFNIENVDYAFCSDDFEVLKISDKGNAKSVIRKLKFDKNKTTSILKFDSNTVNLDFFENKKIDIVGVDLTNGCNLNCTYCFVSAYQKKMRLLTIEKFVEILYFLKNEKENTMHFYFAGAGEPTINFKLLKLIPSLCKENGFNKCIFELTTNGTMLTQEVIDFLKSNNFILLVSMDGSEALHNKTRVYHNGKGSFDAVFKSIKLLQKNEINFKCNTVIQPGNDSLVELFSFFEQNKINFVFNIATNSVSGHFIPQKKDLVIFEGQLSILVDKYKELIEKNIKIHAVKLINDIKKIHFREIHKNGCVASKEGFHIDIDGNIYSCSYHSESIDISVGNIYSGIDYKKIMDNSWYAKPVDSYPTCKKCWMKYLCSGSCFAIKWLENKNTDTPSNYLCKTYDIYWKAIITLYIQIYPSIVSGSNVNFQDL